MHTGQPANIPVMQVQVGRGGIGCDQQHHGQYEFHEFGHKHSRSNGIPYVPQDNRDNQGNQNRDKYPQCRWPSAMHFVERKRMLQKRKGGHVAGVEGGGEQDNQKSHVIHAALPVESGHGEKDSGIHHGHGGFVGIKLLQRVVLAVFPVHLTNEPVHETNSQQCNAHKLEPFDGKWTFQQGVAVEGGCLVGQGAPEPPPTTGGRFIVVVVDIVAVVITAVVTL
mmetsp:Transcript_21506/g.59662  ORF Transcript_21506/g.59662 Transcript_21506/m.59662 type:complete len:223 (-) Transcript_21506:376-1044(-)